MNKLLCFNIRGSNIYKELDLLVYDIPILFVCIDDNRTRYLALCLDIDDTEYYLIPISNCSLKQMITGKKEIRDCFVESEIIYSIKTGKSIDDDRVTALSTNDLSEDDLPDKGAFFTIHNKEIDSFVKKLEYYFPEYSYIFILNYYTQCKTKMDNMTDYFERKMEIITRTKPTFNYNLSFNSSPLKRSIIYEQAIIL